MKKIKKSFHSTKRGSILAYSLIILSMMLAIAAGVSVSTVVERKQAGATEASAQSIQTADSGLQYALKTINDRINAGTGNTAINLAFPNCGAAGYDDSAADDLTNFAHYKLSFYDGSCGVVGNLITPAQCANATLKKIDDIKCVKSVGTYKNTVRVVSMNVLAGNTKLLLHLEENPNFLDVSPSPKIVTSHPGTSVNASTPFSSVSTGSLDNNGNGYLSLDSSTDFDFGTGDFTIEFWEKSKNATNSQMYAFSFGAANNNNVVFNFNNGGGLKAYWNSDGSNPTNRIIAGGVGAYTDGTNWYHIALVMSTGTMKLYINGVQTGGSVGYANPINLAGATSYYIGTSPATSDYWDGNIDEVRISKGVARWTANFTPSATPY